MEVELKRPWFAPYEGAVNGRSVGGRRYRKGRHTLPDSLMPFLPKSAVILSQEATPAPLPVVTAHEARAELNAADESRALAESGPQEPEPEEDNEEDEIAAKQREFQRDLAKATKRSPGRPRKK